jgi:glycosyltransferase involved in cell wall biosynthesis
VTRPTVSGGASRLRIALLGETGAPGGAERMMLQLAGELGRRGHEVFPVLPARRSPWLRTQFSEQGFEPQTFTLRRPVDPVCLSEITRTLARLRIDVVHAHELVTSVYGGIAASLLGMPHVITMHGGRYYAGRRIRRAALRWSARRSRGIVAVSAATAAELTTTLGLAPSEVRVIHNGVRYVPGDRARVRAELGLENHELLIVAIGNLYPVKGHAVLLDALACLEGRREDAPRWRLAIAGQGAEEGRLRDVATQRGWRDRVHLLGFREDAADIMAAADVFALPSLSEGLPLALVEAMFDGKPIVASRVGGIPEVVTNGEEALLAVAGDCADFATQLARLLTNPGLRAELGAAARHRAAARLGVERMTDEYERLYLAARSRQRM